ncbi:hypothetical protein [Streptococcus anginosus]|uniref:hypothetical protein n=1 Tax=Streptococcus anginosus TaxID=1328 RepID=UPI0021F861FE|nr:hypothetical protein [Streptococcus anginosus]MCW0950275.1 hypothetical protein [Streptococcus anginosus]MCW0963826.1 hypothetical protein [Streptococcus anginosus]
MTMLNDIELSPGVGFFKHNGKTVIFRAYSVTHEYRQNKADRMKLDVEVLSTEATNE